MSEAMADEAGAILSLAEMGMPLDHQAVTEVTVELEQVDGGTRMIMTHAGITSDSPGATGWAMAFEKLDVYVSMLPSV